MKRGLIGSTALLILLILGYFLLQEVVITGKTTYEISDPKIYLNLSKTSYAINESLEGFIRLEIESPINAKTKIIAKIDDEKVDEKNITELLENTDNSYETTEEVTIASNAAGSKTLSFSGSSSKQISFVLPKLSRVKSIDMGISGTAEFPYFDVANDEIREWQYFGDFLGFKTEKVYPAGLSTATSGDPSIINTNQTYFCEIINLPLSKNYKVSAKYKRVKEGANITAVILSPSGSNGQITAEGGANFCDLPEPTLNNLDWYSCNINLSKALADEYLICVYLSQSGPENYYELSRDNDLATKSYNCDKPVAGRTTCIKNPSKDYFIAVSGADYSKTLSTNVIFSDWFTNNLFNNSLTNYLTNCEENEIGNCNVPVTVHSDSSGSLTLSNLRIDYTEQSGSSSYTSNFYDLTLINPAIYMINDVNLTKNETNLTISLEEFNLTAPDISDEFEEFNLEMDLEPGADDSEDFTVFSTLIPTGISAIELTINKTKESLTKLKTTTDQNVKIILEELKLQTQIDSALTQLTAYKAQLDSIEESNLSKEEKENKTEIIKLSIDSLKEDLPKTISAKEKITAPLKIEPEDITNEIILESQRDEETKKEIYKLNVDNIKIDALALSFDLVKFDGEKETSTLFKKTVSGDINEVYVVEKIPKSIASDVNEINFILEPEIIEKDPIVRWYFSTLTTKEIDYIVPGDVTKYLDSLTTIVVPKELSAEQISVCGNNICEFITTEEGKKVYLETKESCPEDCARKIPWIYIIIILVFLIAGIWYINFYRGRFKLKTITEKKLFRSSVDYKNLYNYISKALKENFKKEDITNTLLKKGWTKEQIEFIFKKLEPKQKKKQ